MERALAGFIKFKLNKVFGSLKVELISVENMTLSGQA